VEYQYIVECTITALADVFIPSEEGIKYFDVAVFAFSFLHIIITVPAPGIREVAISIPCHTAIHCLPRALIDEFIVTARWTDKRERVSR